MTTLHTTDDDCFTWMPGDNSLGIVNTDNMYHDLISNFFGREHESVIPITIVSAPTQQKYMGLYITQVDGDINFAFMRKDQQICRKSQTDVIGSGKIFRN